MSGSETQGPAQARYGAADSPQPCPCLSVTQVGGPASLSPASPGVRVGDDHLLQMSSAASWLKSRCWRTLLRAWTAHSSRRCCSWYTEGGPWDMPPLAPA